MKPFACLDCRFDTGVCAGNEYYMVHNSVWKESGLRPDGGLLCIKCLERRLGRRLARYDFTTAPINRGVFPQSRRLTARLKSSRSTGVRKS